MHGKVEIESSLGKDLGLLSSLECCKTKYDLEVGWLLTGFEAPDRQHARRHPAGDLSRVRRADHGGR